jgi:hypothetical protein
MFLPIFMDDKSTFGFIHFTMVLFLIVFLRSLLFLLFACGRFIVIYGKMTALFFEVSEVDLDRFGSLRMTFLSFDTNSFCTLFWSVSISTTVTFATCFSSGSSSNSCGFGFSRTK